jgi:hypothetical protein
MRLTFIFLTLLLFACEQSNEPISDIQVYKGENKFISRIDNINFYLEYKGIENGIVKLNWNDGVNSFGVDKVSGKWVQLMPFSYEVVLANDRFIVIKLKD